MTTSRPCPVVGCTGMAVDSLAIALLPAGGPGRNRWIASCPACWRRVGAGAPVHVEVDADDRGRRWPRVRIELPG